MTKQQVTIEVDVPEGWKLVKSFYDSHPSTMSHNQMVFRTEILLCKAWQWPAWLKAEWIAMDKDGGWWGYMDEPSKEHCVWNSHEGGVEIGKQMLDFTPPPCTDWRTSKRKRPT